MISFFRKRPRPQVVPVQLPGEYGERPELPVLQAALSDNASSAEVRAIIHLILMRRTHVSLLARAVAKQGKDAAFDLGGVDVLDELFADIHGLIHKQEPGDLVKDWFTEEGAR